MTNLESGLDDFGNIEKWVREQSERLVRDSRESVTRFQDNVSFLGEWTDSGRSWEILGNTFMKIFHDEEGFLVRPTLYEVEMNLMTVLSEEYRSVEYLRVA